MSEESWLALTGSVEPSPRFGGLASQSFELLALRVFVGLRVAGTGWVIMSRGCRGLRSCVGW